MESLVRKGWSTTANTTLVTFPQATGKIVIGLVLVAALTAPCTGIKLSSGGAPADAFIVLALSVVGLMVIFGDLRFSLPNWPVVPCLAIAICVLVRQIDPAPSYVRVFRLQIYESAPDDVTKALFWMFAIIFIPSAIVACMAIDRRSAVWIMAAFVSGATLSSGVAVTDLIGLTPNIGRTLGEGTQICAYKCVNAGLGARMNGLADHPNTLGLTAAISIPIVMYFMTTMSRKWIAAIALVVLFGGILASGSRAAQAAAPLCALVGMLLMPKSRPLGLARTISALGAVLGGLIVLMTLPSHVRQELFRIFDNSRDALGSDSERLKVFRAGMADWQAHPIFGSGISHIVEAHNIFLQFLASGGMVLAMSMLIYFFVVFRQAWILSSRGIIFARFLMLSVGTWLVLGLVENAITDRYLYYTIGCIAALASANLNQQLPAAESLDTREPAASSPPP
jgi:hypothetical protein